MNTLAKLGLAGAAAWVAVLCWGLKILEVANPERDTETFDRFGNASKNGPSQ